jgi:D-alanine-D-alanine ligase
VPALCELFDQAYLFSDPLTLAVALDKAAAKRIVRDAGVATAPFVVVAQGARVPALPFAFPVFVKPLAEGTGKGCEISSLCRDPEQLQASVAALTQRFEQPAIIEPFLSGREFTVGLVEGVRGLLTVGTMEVVLLPDADAGIYSYRNKDEYEQLVTYRTADGDPLAAQVEACAIAAYRALECRDCARIDIRCDSDGAPHFLEANPLPGLHPTHSDLPIAATLAGHSYDWLLNAIVSAAARRYQLRLPSVSSPKRGRAFVPVLHAASAERADERDTLEAAAAVAAALEASGYVSEVVRFRPASAGLEELARRAPLAVFNLVEAIDGMAQASCLAPWYLERCHLAYTGNGYAASVATASKLLSKGLLLAHGLSTPALVSDTTRELHEVILKPVWEHASVGIDAGSVMPATHMARARAEREAQFGLAFFAERYISGREFNVALLGQGAQVTVLPVQETLFVDWPATRARIVDYEAKWVSESAASRQTPRLFGVEQRDPELAASLISLARQVWQVFGLSGYARIDLRVAEDGTVYVIDVNANPGLGPDAGFVAAALEQGLSFQALVAELVEITTCRRLVA